MTITNQGDIYRVTACVQLGAQQAQNVTHWSVLATIGNPDVTLVGSKLSAVLAPVYKPLFGVTTNFLGLKVQRIHPLPKLLPAKVVTDAGPGTAAGDTLPKQTCGVITWLTLFAGPAYRGRLYVPFPTEDHCTGEGKPTVAYFNLMINLANVYTSNHTATFGIDSADIAMHLPSRPGPNHNLTYINVESHRVNDRFGTQRRRSDYGALNAAAL